MLKHLLLVLVLAGPAAHGQTEWLTVMGDPANLLTDTIQVDPNPLSVAGDHRTMRVRVSRAAQHVNWDGVPYRSYDASVMFDCASHTARYLEIRFYLQPGWQGDIHKTVSYATGVPRWILIRELEPNPYRRIIHAACGAFQPR